MSDTALQQKLAAIFAANKDDVSVPKIYIDMTGSWETGAVLDEIMFWTLPKKNTGKTSLRVFREGKLWLAVRRSDWWNRKRLTERQADNAISKLVAQSLIEKDVFLFDGKPTVHLRLKMQEFTKIYTEKLSEYAKEEDDETLIRDISDLYEMMGFPNQTVKSILPKREMLNSPNGEIINSPIQPEKTAMPKGDLVDFELSKLPSMSVRKAVVEHFKLNVNWETKSSHQWLEWAEREGITPEQIKHASEVWRTDKQFNWTHPTLKGIFEKWQLLMASGTQPQPNEGHLL